MECNSDKCKVINFRTLNQDRTNSVNDRALARVAEQKGIQVNSSLKMVTQVDRVTKKAYDMLALIGH